MGGSAKTAAPLPVPCRSSAERWWTADIAAPQHMRPCSQQHKTYRRHGEPIEM
jgi:hypothetical protein